MALIDTVLLPGAWRAADLWPTVAGSCAAWLDRHGLPARDAVLLLPFSALLAPARAAFAAAGGWQPRIETPLTLAATLGPPPVAESGSCLGDPTHDQLAAAALLRRLDWGAAWERRDATGFARITGLVVDAAQLLRDAALARAPAARPAWWAEVRALVPAPGGPALQEGLLLRLAVEWAATAGTTATDSLFTLRPAAWMALQIGGADPLAEALMAASDGPALRLQADPPADAPWAPPAATATLERVLCEDVEAEAQAAAAEVIGALNAGRVPVALVALDRAGVRRVRALLERAGVPLVDETGWRLATTRAAADVVALLRAALPGASADDRLDWLKTWPVAVAAPQALDALEALWRGRRRVVARDAGEALWAEAQLHLAPLAEGGTRPLATWLDTTQGMLAREGSIERLAADAAGAQVLAALGWQSGVSWRSVAAEVRLDLRGFIAWVMSTLEAASFLPPPDAAAQVVLTPLSRAFGRPFGHVVVPGADAARLGASDPAPTLLNRALVEALGLPDATSRRARQRWALAHALRAGGATLLRRARDGAEPVADSPELEWWLLDRARAGGTTVPQRTWQPPTVAVAPAAPARPLPTGAAALPAQLSASQLEALRQCPYRFFARAVLRLDEPEELDAALAKRDYGNWLHAVLHHFHSQRDRAAPDAAQLQAAAEAATAALALDAAELLPYRASFEDFAPRYLAWLAQREAAGWHWQDGESDYRAAPPELGGLELRGRIDRLDAGPDGAGQLLDYKTGSADALARKVRAPLEDTQLAFYAALLGGAPSLAAAYLALDDADAPREIVHPEVHETAAVLLRGLGDEWQRLREGAAMPALGEGAVCETCEARGLCRRDHWGAAS